MFRILSIKSNYLPCGIGSLPFCDADAAVGFVFKYMKEVPHWPQLPKRQKEHFVFQFLSALLDFGLLEIDRERPVFSTLERDQKIEKFYYSFLDADQGKKSEINRFASPPEAAPGIYKFFKSFKKLNGETSAVAVKGQVSGPLSTALNIKDEQGKPVFYDLQLRDLVIKTLAVNSRWQTAYLSQLGLPVILFIDDPAVSAYGHSSFISLSRNDIVASIKELVEAVEKEQGAAGAHSCAGGDWSIFMEAGCKILSIDSYNYFPSLLPYIEQLKEFVENGGFLALGTVPTLNDRESLPTVQDLVNMVESQLALLVKKGVSEAKLKNQSLISPSCGLATLEENQAETIYKLTAEVSMTLKANLG